MNKKDRKGWHSEPVRHSLAAKGVKVKQSSEDEEEKKENLEEKKEYIEKIEKRLTLVIDSVCNYHNVEQNINTSVVGSEHEVELRVIEKEKSLELIMSADTINLTHLLETLSDKITQDVDQRLKKWLELYDDLEIDDLIDEYKKCIGSYEDDNRDEDSSTDNEESQTGSEKLKEWLFESDNRTLKKYESLKKALHDQENDEDTIFK